MNLHVGSKMESRLVLLDYVAQTIVSEVSLLWFPEPALGDQKADSTLCEQQQVRYI